jgi:hypothetical protein
LYLLYEESGSKSVFVGPITLINMHGNTEIVSITISITKRGQNTRTLKWSQTRKIMNYSLI